MPRRQDVATRPSLLSPELLARLRCPTCASELARHGDLLSCTGGSHTFPVVDGRPVLISENRSIFSATDSVATRENLFFKDYRSSLRRVAKRVLPVKSVNLSAEGRLHGLGELIVSESGSPRVLVIGSGMEGRGMEALTDDPDIELVLADVIMTAEASLAFDAHDVPFADATFDAVVIQAVLEHVLDPARCVREIERVLRPGGYVYAETPFMQQVHGGRYDFTRFTPLGHRRLFRNFEEIASDIVAGPGTSLAWSWEYFLMSFSRSGRTRTIAKGIGRLSSFYLAYFDKMLARRPGAWDSASAVSFLGRKAPPGWVLSDADLLQSYKGSGG